MDSLKQRFKKAYSITRGAIREAEQHGNKHVAPVAARGFAVSAHHIEPYNKPIVFLAGTDKNVVRAISKTLINRDISVSVTDW